MQFRPSLLRAVYYLMYGEPFVAVQLVNAIVARC